MNQIPMLHVSISSLLLLLTACPPPPTVATPPSPSAAPTGFDAPAPEQQPYVLVLGTAQDAGLPHIGCHADHCERARRDARHRRLVSSLLLCDPRSGQRWLFDASPDMPTQIARANRHPASRSSDAPRPALFEGIFLTHAHMGHYTGLMHLGREAYSAKQVPVFGTERMRTFLRNNGPWSQLVSLKNITLRELYVDQAVSLNDGLEVTPLPVVHRDEYSDTVAFVIAGPRRKLLYLPDIDKWSRWDRSIEELITSVDIALIDGTFFAEGEIPGRAMSEIPHPFIMESLKRFAKLPDAERAKVLFTHLNHSNPAADPKGEAAAQIRAAGMAVAHDGQLFAL